MNKSILVGRWVKDTELKFTSGNGTAVLTGTIAVDRRFKKEGEQSADFIGIVIWGKQAESTANYCGSKGDKIGIVGRIQTRTYKNKEDKTVYVTEVVAEEVDFMNEKKSSNNNTPAAGNSEGNTEGFNADITPVDDGDPIPF